MSYEILILPLLMIMSALMSGASLAILGVDLNELERKAKLGDKRAEKIIPLRKLGNRTLCTINLTNVLVNTILTYILSQIASGTIAVISATASIVIFGEILPQALCNKNKILFGSMVAPILKPMLYILYPVTKPVSMLLDKLLGKDMPTMHTSQELEEIIKSNHNIDSDEKAIAVGSLTYSSKKAIEVMTPINKVYCLDLNEQVSIEEIKNETYSRIPVYDEQRDNIVGILYAKELLGQTGTFKVDKYVKNKIIKIDENTNLDILLNIMTKERNHMSFVYDEFGVLRGIVTYEDIVESIVGREIIDEHDNEADLQESARKEFDGETYKHNE